MIYEELLEKFDRIQDLPISEEMLGAYVEDNLSPIEKHEVESAIQKYDYLKDFLYSNAEYDIDRDGLSIDSIPDDFELPIIPDDSYIGLDLEYPSSFPELEDIDLMEARDSDNICSQEDSYADDTVDNQFEDDNTLFDSSDDNDFSDYE